MKKQSKRLVAISFVFIMLVTTFCFVACSPYSGHYEQVGEDELESKSEELERLVNKTVNSMLWNDLMPNYKAVYTISEKTEYLNPKFSTETEIKVVKYGYEGLTQSQIEFHKIQLTNETEFLILGEDPVLEEINFTVTFWYGEELENTYYELVIDGKKEQDVLLYSYGRDELKMASHYDEFFQRHIRSDIETALTFDYKLYFDGENKIKIDSIANESMEKWTILAYLIISDNDTVYYKETEEHNQKNRGHVDWDYYSKSALEITPSTTKITLPNFANS